MQLAGALRTAERAHRAYRAELRLGDVDRTRPSVACSRTTEIEQALSRRGHQDDGDDAGWLEPGNLAADLYLDELDEGLAEELRDGSPPSLRAPSSVLLQGTYSLSIESGQLIPDERLEALPTAGRTVKEERTPADGRGS